MMRTVITGLRYLLFPIPKLIQGYDSKFRGVRQVSLTRDEVR